MRILHLGCFTSSVIIKLPRVSSTTTAAAPLSSIRFFSFQPSFTKQRQFSLRTSPKRFMCSGGDKRNFPEVISAAISSLNTNVAPFMSAELRKLYGGVPDEEVATEAEAVLRPAHGGRQSAV